ncbi:MAG: hypothetical protein ACRBDL_06265 [Alphaproteobacteria bacterium]
MHYSPESNNDPRIPITIGIVGHRDLPSEDLPMLRAALQKALREIKDRFPNSPLLCVTSLADGADQLGFDVAHKEQIDNLVILPMPYKDYLEDFGDNPDHFITRWENADQTYILPQISATLERDLQYESAASLISSNVHFLIALWDGKSTNLKGGTGDTVYRRLEPQILDNNVLFNWLCPSRETLKFSETGPLLHIHTRRSDKENNIPVGKIEWKNPQWLKTKNRKAFFTLMDDHDRLNKDIKNRGTFEIDKYQQLMTKEELQSLQEEPIDILRFSVLDSLAIRLRKYQRWFLFLMIFLSWTVLFFYEMYGNSSYDNLNFYMGCYLGTMILSWLIYKLISHLHWHDRFIDYRAFSEALRVQFFWKRYGIQANVADFCLEEQIYDLSWIRFGLRSCYLSSLSNYPININREEVYNLWISGQEAYFKNSRLHNEKYMTLFKKLTPTFLFSGIALIILHSILANIFILGSHSIETEKYENLLDIILNVSVILPTIAIVIELFIKIEGYEEHLNQYEKMSKVYQKAHSILSDDTINNSIIMELGKSALTENAFWLNTHRSKHIQIIM